MTTEMLTYNNESSPAHVDAPAASGSGSRRTEPHALEEDGTATIRQQSRESRRRTVSGPPTPGGPMALLDAYHELLREAVRYASERGFFRSWDDDGLPQVKVYVGPRDESGRPGGLLVLRAQAAFDFAWRMYDWAMGEKRAAERAHNGAGVTSSWARRGTATREQRSGIATALR